MLSAAIADGRGSRTISYVTDAVGQVLIRQDSTGPKERYVYFNAQRVGDLGADGPSGADYTYVQALAGRGAAAQTTAYQDDSNTTGQSFVDFDQA